MSAKKLLLLSTTAFVATAGLALADTIAFAPVPVPTTDAAKRVIQASDTVTIDGTAHAIGYHVLMRSGDQAGDGTFGLLVDAQGAPVRSADGSQHVSVDADFSSLLPVGDRLFGVTHFESRPGAMYLNEFHQDPATGALTLIATTPIDFSALGGLWVPCAGSVTPWNTHLGSEEYEPDARAIADATALSDIDDYYFPMARYFGLNPETMTLDAFRTAFNPYRYGHPVEVSVDAQGQATPVKHYAMGRLAFELEYVMPDQRTAYMSDDGTNVGLYMFVADVAGDLSAGTLYAAHLMQTSGEGAGAFDLDWVDLGHASDAEVQAIIDTAPSFHDIFDAVAPGEDHSCAQGYSSINTSVGRECLMVRPGMDLAASRLETRRYAAMRGATTELRKEEGITFDPASGTLFVAMSEIGKGMEAGARQDRGGPDDVRLAANPCGAVYALPVGRAEGIDSAYVARSMAGLVAGTPTEYADGTAYHGNTCDVDGIANPDNITFLTGSRTLIIGEDTGSGHQNDAIWAYDLDSEALTRIETTPYGSETTSAYYYPDINGWGYLMSVVQHPYGESDEDQLADAADARAYVGYVGPFPAR